MRHNNTPLAVTVQSRQRGALKKAEHSKLSPKNTRSFPIGQSGHNSAPPQGAVISIVGREYKNKIILEEIEEEVRTVGISPRDLLYCSLPGTKLCRQFLEISNRPVSGQLLREEFKLPNITQTIEKFRLEGLNVIETEPGWYQVVEAV